MNLCSAFCSWVWSLLYRDKICICREHTLSSPCIGKLLQFTRSFRDALFPRGRVHSSYLLKISLMLSRTEVRRGSPWGYMSIAYRKGNGFEKEMVPAFSMAFVHVAHMIWPLVITCCLLPQIFSSAFSLIRNDNVCQVFWPFWNTSLMLTNPACRVTYLNLQLLGGQDSAGNQQRLEPENIHYFSESRTSVWRLSFYCNDDTIDVIPMAFLYSFFGESGQPVIDFANVKL